MGRDGKGEWEEIENGKAWNVRKWEGLERMGRLLERMGRLRGSMGRVIENGTAWNKRKWED